MSILSTLKSIFQRFYFLILILSVILFVLTLGDSFPLYWKQVAYTLSDGIRSILVFLLPILVLPYIITSIALLKSRGFLLLLSLVSLITLSNFFSTCIGGGLAALFVPLMSLQTTFDPGDAEPLQALFTLNLPTLISIEIVLVIGFILGLIQGIYQNNTLQSFLGKYRSVSTLFFEKLFIPLMPVYIFGNMLKIDMENDFLQVFSDFGSVITIIALSQILYVTLLFWIGCKFSFSRTLSAIRNSLPAWVLGFSTLSSLVTMPVTLKAAEKNVGDKAIARLAITSTVNCHTIGDCISFMALSITVLLMSTGMQTPDLYSILMFALIFALAQFTAVSVPGGGAVIVIPLLIKYFNFSPEMVGLVTTLAVFLEPLSTSHNVHGNSAFAILLHRFVQKFHSNIKTQS